MTHKMVDRTFGINDNLDEVNAEIQKLMRGKSPSVILVPSKNLLDVTLEKLQKGDEERKNVLHRMVVVSKMYHQNFQEIGQSYEKFFKDIQAQTQCDAVTGLLLLYPKHCVHVLESSQDVFLEVVRDLHRDAEAGEGKMEKSTILIVSHDIPQRLYQQWSFRVLDIEAPHMAEYEPSEATEKVVVDMLSQLLKLGIHLSRQPKLALKTTMDTLHEKVPYLLPQQEIIGFLLETEDPCITKPEDYINLYQKPYDVVLNSELVWPINHKLFPYNPQ